MQVLYGLLDLLLASSLRLLRANLYPLDHILGTSHRTGHFITPNGRILLILGSKPVELALEAGVRALGLGHFLWVELVGADTGIVDSAADLVFEEVAGLDATAQDCC